MDVHRDVVVVGAGVVGAAIARELARLDLRVTLLEAGPDVGAGTSKANTALLHTGFDAKPGTLEARLVARGYELLSHYAPRVGIPVERTGALLVAWNDDQRAEFAGIVERAGANGHELPAELDAGGVYRRESHLGPGARGALEVSGEALICPFTTPLAFATEAVLAGCELRLATPVTGLERVAEGGFRVQAPGASFTTERLVNAAGLRSDELDRMLGGGSFDGHPAPRRADRVRQAGAPTGQPDRPRRTDPHVEGRARLPDRVRQRDGGPHRRRRRQQGRHLLHRRGPRLPERRGRPHRARAARARRDGGVRRPARRHRARRLPDSLRGRLCVRGWDPLDRVVGLDGDRRARARRTGAGRARAAARVDRAAHAEPRRGESRDPSRAPS